MLFKTTTFWVVCLTGSLMDMVYYPIGFQMLQMTNLRLNMSKVAADSV
jgi:hypothetical protein